MATRFANSTDRAFAALIDAFKLDRSYASDDNFGSSVTYQNGKCALRVAYDRREGLLDIRLYRTTSGSVLPSGDVTTTKADPLNGFNVDDLLQLRTTDVECVVQHPRPGLTNDEIDSLLQRYAGLLEKYASDVLSGESGAFREMAGIVVRRIRALSVEGYHIGPDGQAILRAYDNMADFDA